MSLDPDNTIEEALWTKVQSVTAVTDIISTRLYPIQLRQNPTYPAMTYSLVGDRNLMYVNAVGDMYWARFQFDVYARSYTQAKRLARELRVALDGFTGTVGSRDLCRVVFLNEVDDFEPVAGIYMIPVDFRIQYK